MFEYSPAAHAWHSFLAFVVSCWGDVSIIIIIVDNFGIPGDGTDAIAPLAVYVRAGHSLHLSYAVGARLYPSAQYCPKGRNIFAWRGVVYN